MRLPLPLLLSTALAASPAFPPATSTGAPGKPKKVRAAGPVHSAREARDIAERETGGIAVNARKTSLNGASCGWEVDVHMPKEDRGWRCMVDCDTHMVHTKDRIPNPPRPKRS